MGISTLIQTGKQNKDRRKSHFSCQEQRKRAEEKLRAAEALIKELKEKAAVKME